MKRIMVMVSLLVFSCSTAPNYYSFDNALEMGTEKIQKDLPTGTEVAILDFKSDNENLSAYVIEEMYDKLINFGKLSIMERSRTNTIAMETGYQFSGEVDDSEIIAIGHQLGADYVVTGQIIYSGEAYRLRVFAIDIAKGRRVASSSLNIDPNDRQIKYLLTSKTGGKAPIEGTSIPEGLLYEIVDRKTVTITKYVGNAATVNIPSRILDFPVTTIGDYAFSRCESLTSITIPSSVTSIGDSPFLSCYSLTNITIDNRNPVYTSVDGVLFDKNIRTLIKYPSGRNQKTYVIPSSVMSIGDFAFYSCSSLTSITIPSSVTSIGAYVFDFCFSLTSFTVDNRNPVYASVDGVLFDKNIRTLINYPLGRNQKTYAIPSSVITIGGGAFHHCKSLTSITIPNSVTIIEGYAFTGSQLTSVSIPNSVISIGGFAFQGNQLTSVTIPNSVTEIGIGAFAGNQLTSVTIPNSVTEIEGNELPWGIGAFTGNRLNSVTIPNSVTSIGYSAFKNNQLTSITIPNSVTSIAGQAFQGNRLVSITIGANVDMFVNYDNSFDYGFADFYYAQGRRAGTYTYRNGSWSRQ